MPATSPRAPRLLVPSLVLGAVLVAAPLAVGAASADTVSRVIPTAIAPVTIAATPDGSKIVMVGNGVGEVSVLDVASGTESAPINAGGSVYNLAVTPDGTTALVPTTSGRLVVIDIATASQIDSVPIGNYAFDVAVSDDGLSAYVGNAGTYTIEVVDIASRSIVRTIALPVGFTPFGVAITPDQNRLVVTDANTTRLAVVEIASGAVLATHALSGLPLFVEVSGDGTKAYVGGLGFGQPVAVDLVTGVLSPLTTTAGSVYNFAVSPDGSRLYLAANTGIVSILDTATDTEVDTIDVGDSSLGISFTANGATAFIGDANAPAIVVLAADVAPSLVASLPTATVGSAYSAALAVVGSPAPTYVVTAGALPAGLALDAATGVISGTATTAGTFDVTITATNARGTDSQAYSLTVAGVLVAAGASAEPLAVTAGLLLVGGLVLALRRRRRVH